MTYAEDPCADCGLYLPRKDLHDWVETRETGRESGTFQRFASGRTGYRAGKVTYRTDHLQLCPECFSKRWEARQATKRRALLTASLVILAIIVAVLVGSTMLRSSPAASGSASNATPDNAVAATATNEAASTANAPFDVTLGLSVTGGPNAVVAGTTNLPDGTILLVQLRKPYPACYGHCLAFRPAGAKDTMEGGEVVVEQGRFVAGPAWSDADDPAHDGTAGGLPPGTYVLEVRSQLGMYQPAAVRAVIGDQGQNMQGTLVDACCLANGPEDAAMTAKEKAGIDQAEPMAGHQVYFAQLLAVASQAAPAGDVLAAPSPPAGEAHRPGGSTLSVAVNQALETGQSAPWSEGPESGVVSVGERRIWRGRDCRTYGFTTNGVRSPVVISCQAADGSWHPAATYTPATAPPQPLPSE